MASSGETDRRRITLFSVLFGLLVIPQFIRDPLTATGMLLGTGILAGTIAVVVFRFRRILDEAMPEGLIRHRSTSVRAMTQLARVYGLYLAGFFTFIALLLLFQAFGYLI